MDDRDLDPALKVLGRDAVVRRVRDASLRPLVFTNGCFDVLHRGHVAYLAHARALGATLLVGVNSDTSVRRLKGRGRPLVSVEDRAFVLAGLASVDLVTVFEEDTPLDLIRDVRPDVLVKGGDYAEDQVVGREVVEASGGRVVILPFVEGRSTTDLIRRIREERR
jgi:rfaE bifunctional protein nucleotidyltransferase chain/domain